MGKHKNRLIDKIRDIVSPVSNDNKSKEVKSEETQEKDITTTTTEVKKDFHKHNHRKFFRGY